MAKIRNNYDMPSEAITSRIKIITHRRRFVSPRKHHRLGWSSPSFNNHSSVDLFSYFTIFDGALPRFECLPYSAALTDDCIAAAAH